MDEIELECPKCSTWLKLDAGFAGGVCRCSNCGTLMTVPADPSNEKAEEVVGRRRPLRPGEAPPPARPSRPARPGSPAEASPEAPEAAEPHEVESDVYEPLEPQPQDDPKRRGKKSGRQRKPSRAEAADDGEQILVTKSGKKIRIASQRSIPTARKSKRMVVRVVTICVFVGILLSIVAISGVAIYMLSQFDPEKAVEEAIQQQTENFQVQNFAYDRRMSPYDIAEPNVVGYPFRGRTFVIIDGSEGAEKYLPVIADIIGAGIDKAQMTSARYNMGVATDEGLSYYENGMRSVKGASGNSLANFIKGVKPRGKADIAKAIEQAAEEDPWQILIITARKPEDSGGYDEINNALTKLQDRIEADKKVRAVFGLDVLMIDTRSISWEDLARAHVGEYNVQMLTQLKQWQDDHKNGGDAAK